LIVQWASDPILWKPQQRETEADEWQDVIGVPMWYGDMYYRLIPRRKMMHLNGMEFPAPEREAPPLFTDYYIPDPTFTLAHLLSSQLTWGKHEGHYRRLKAGVVHLTREAAEAHARAMLNAKEVG
jgi:hypothetical protein